MRRFCAVGSCVGLPHGFLGGVSSLGGLTGFRGGGISTLGRAGRPIAHLNFTAGTMSIRPSKT
jgi:hypothetical protein